MTDSSSGNPGGGRHGSRGGSGLSSTLKRRSTIVAAALVGCLIGGIVALANTGGSANDAKPDSGDQTSQGGPGDTSSTPPPVQPKPVSAAALAVLPKAQTEGKTVNAPADDNPAAATDGGVVHPEKSMPIYASPGGAAIAELPTIEVGSPTWVPVVGRQPGWVQILLPSKPNGRVGWLWNGDDSLQLAKTDYLVKVSIENFSLDLIKNGKSIGKWTVGVGSTVDPTPHGRTFILGSFTDPSQTYSPIILPLGIHSPTLDTFGGGPGTVAIHTWPSASVFGTKSSNGCIRVPSEALDLIKQAPIGTIVLIS